MKTLSILNINSELTHATIRARVDCYAQVHELLAENNFFVEQIERDIEKMCFDFKVLLPQDYVFHYLALREAVDKQEA